MYTSLMINVIYNPIIALALIEVIWKQLEITDIV